MKKVICNKCQSSNVDLIHEEYQGDHTTLTYQCSDCKHKTTNYHDIIYSILKNPISQMQ